MVTVGIVTARRGGGGPLYVVCGGIRCKTWNSSGSVSRRNAGTVLINELLCSPAQGGALSDTAIRPSVCPSVYPMAQLP